MPLPIVNPIKTNHWLWQGSFAQFCQRLDAEYQLPRPATAQHLPAYQAALQLFQVIRQCVSLVLAGLVAGWLFVLAAQWLAFSLMLELSAHCLAIVTVLIALAEAAQLWLPYYQVGQRTTHGTARWADAATLTGLRLALKREMPLPPLTLLLGRLGRKHHVVLGPEHAVCHLAMFGPPGSGKSSTFFITWQRAWAQTGSVVVLDPKGELYDQTAYLFRNVYRLDLQSPERSDRWNFLPACKENAEYAHKVASLILDTEQSKRSSADPFWKEAEKAALTAILLQLCQLHERPAPPMIQELISTLSLTDLNKLMMESRDPKVPLYWGMFSKVEPKLQAGVLIGLGVACADFSTPHLTMIASPITQLMQRRGIRFVDFSELRQAGTALFIVVPEGDAELYKRVLSTLIGLINDTLRNAEINETAAPVLFNLDEIGNIHIPDLPAALGVGRGRRMTYALGYQNIAQLYHQYGTDGGDAVLGSVGAMLFLPGVDQRTAEYAAKRLGATTLLQSTSVDVKHGDKFDSERTSETGRALMDAAEIRQMLKYQQALAIVSNAPPIRLGYPPFAKVAQPPLAEREVRYRREMGEVGEVGEAALLMDGLNLATRTQASAPTRSSWGQLAPPIDNKLPLLLRFEPEYDPDRLSPDQLADAVLPFF
jgi:type IV secretion system protein VirD4